MARVAALLMHPATPAIVGNLILLIMLVVALSGHRMIDGHLADTIAY